MSSNAAASSSPAKPAFTPAMRRVADHENTQIAWVCRPEGDKIVRMAQISVLWGRTGSVSILVRSWGESGQEPCVFHYGKAGGYGYNKVAAALEGANVAGVVVTAHGANSLSSVCDQRGWSIIGGNVSFSH